MAAQALRNDSMSQDVLKTLESALETMVKTTPLLLNAHIDDANLRSVVFYPAVSDDGQSNLGQTHRKRPHAQAFKLAAGQMLVSPVFQATGATNQKTVNLSMLVTEESSELKLGVVSAALNLSAVIEEQPRMLDSSIRVAIFDSNSERIFPGHSTPFDSVELKDRHKEVLLHHTDQQSWFYAVEKLPAHLGAWTVVVYEDSERILSEKSAIWKTAGISLLFVIILSAICVVFLSSSFSQAIEKLVRHVQSRKPLPADEDRVVFPRELVVVQHALTRTSLQLQQKHQALQELNRELEEKIRKRTQSLQLRNEILQALFDSMSEGVILFDAVGHCLRTNQQADTLLNKSEIQNLYQQLSSLTDTKPTHLLRMKERTLEVARFDLQPTFEKDAVGVLVRDVTDREELDAMKQTLLSMAAHELKTPVHAMRLQIDALRRHVGADVPQPQQMLLQDLYASARHLQELVRDWLDVARMDAGAFEVERMPLSLDSVIRQAVSRTAVRWPDQKVKVCIEEDAEGIVGDVNRLQQLFYNLLSNSARYARPGIASRVIITCRLLEETTPRVLIRISDNGIGIVPEHAQRIFDRFYQIESGNRRRSGGTGLGLVIVRAIVQAHGGSIRLVQPEKDSELQGAVFEIEIPCYPADYVLSQTD